MEPKKGGVSVRPSERRQAIWEALRLRRQDTAENLAWEFGVSVRTILTDVGELTLHYQIETVRGRYSGGIKVPDWYHPTRKTLCPEQIRALRRLATSTEGKDLCAINSILDQFAP